MVQVDDLKRILLDDSVKNILILPHNMPDGDTLGSCIGMYHLVKNFGKKGYIVLNDGIPSNLSFLFENEARCLTTEQVEGVSFDACIAIDSGETKLFEDRIELFQSGRYRINIDHHKTNSYYGELNIVDVDASSTGEIVYMLYEALECPLDSVSAEALYAAIVTDTGSFRYSNTRPVTFSICRKLQETGFDFNRLNVEIFQNKSYEKVLLLNKVFETLKLYTDGKCAVIKLSKELIENLSLHEYDTDGIVEFVRDIKGVEVVVFIRHLGGIAHKVSMRSKYDFDVSEIALKFKGGGHKKAAGFKMDQPIDVIETLVVDAIGAAL
jgi:phosphoesterase RecJ-like protein